MRLRETVRRLLRTGSWRADEEPQVRALLRAVYLNLLGREADEPGLEHWLGVLRRGGSFDSVIEGFRRSPEYAARLVPSANDLRSADLTPEQKAWLRAHDLGQAQQAFLRGFGYGRDYAAEPHAATPRAATPANPLEAWFETHTEGPGIWKWRHYFDAYHRHLSRFIGQEVNVLEIGVYSGGSLALWQHYLGPRCKVWGVDIFEGCRSYETDRVKILIGDQGDRAFWKRVRAEVPPMDIVLDDGSHQTPHQIVSLEELLPHVRPGGVYAVEDLYRESNAFHDYVAGLTHHLNTLGPPKPGSTDFHEGAVTNGLQRAVQSVHLYPFVTVIEKAATPVSEFTAPRRGTQWQPWP